MLAGIGSRLRYANVMSTVALFIALGGGAYAAFKLPNGSVGSKQLKNGAVTNKKLANNAVTGAKVKAGSLTGKQIDVSTLGTVPNATHATSADTATSATHASSADTATSADTLSGLAAGQFVQGGGQFRSFGFTMSTASFATDTLLSVPGFGTLTAFCGTSGDEIADVDFMTGSQTLDRFGASLDSASDVGVGSTTMSPNTNFLFASATASGVSNVWERAILRYAVGSTTHMATLDFMVNVNSTTCDFDASAIIGPGVQGP